MNKIYRGGKKILPKGNTEYLIIYYKPKGYHKYYALELMVDSNDKRNTMKVEENDYHLITRIDADAGLPDDTNEYEECFGIDVPQCCRRIFDLLDNSCNR